MQVFDLNYKEKRNKISSRVMIVSGKQHIIKEAIETTFNIIGFYNYDNDKIEEIVLELLRMNKRLGFAEVKVEIMPDVTIIFDILATKDYRKYKGQRRNLVFVGKTWEKKLDLQNKDNEPYYTFKSITIYNDMFDTMDKPYIMLY